MLCITVFLPPNNFFLTPYYFVFDLYHHKLHRHATSTPKISTFSANMCLTVCLFLYFPPFSRLINFYVVARVAKIYCHAICTIIYISRVGIHYFFSFLIVKEIAIFYGFLDIKTIKTLASLAH